MSLSLPELPSAFVLSTETVTRTTLYRVYWQGLEPLMPGAVGRGRFSCPDDAPPRSTFGALYLGYDLPTCWMETVIRGNVVRRAGDPIPIPVQSVAGRMVCEVTFTEPLLLAHLADEPLIDLGDCASNLMGDSYTRTQAWSLLLHAHENPQVDGIRYRSRFSTGQFCIALFERAILAKGLKAVNARSIDPSTSVEAQSIMRRFNVVAIRGRAASAPNDEEASQAT